LNDRTTRARIRVRLNRIRLDNFGNSKPEGGGVSELRVDYGPGYRIYFSREGSTVVILICGGIKNSQSKDIKLAKKHWTVYRRRI